MNVDPYAAPRTTLGELPEPIDGDAESAAFAELGRRVSRVRMRLAAVTGVAAIVVGVVAYVVLRDWQFRTEGAHSVLLTAALSFGPSFFGVGAAGAFASRLLVRARLPGWIAELSQLTGIDPARFEDASIAWRG